MKQIKTIGATILVVACMTTAFSQEYQIVDLWQGNATGINSSGQVVGNGGTDGYLYSNGAITDLGINTAAYGINDFGQVAGVNQVPSNSGQNAALWNNGVWNNFAPSPNAYNSSAIGVNNSGTVIGQAGFNSQLGQASGNFVKSGGTTWIGVNNSSLTFFQAINSKGQVVGVSTVNSENNGIYHTFVWSFLGGNLQSAIDLGVPVGFYSSWAEAINNKGQIAGYGRNGRQRQ